MWVASEEGDNPLVCEDGDKPLDTTPDSPRDRGEHVYSLVHGLLQRFETESVGVGESGNRLSDLRGVGVWVASVRDDGDKTVLLLTLSEDDHNQSSLRSAPWLCGVCVCV